MKNEILARVVERKMDAREAVSALSRHGIAMTVGEVIKAANEMRRERANKIGYKIK